MKALIIYKSTHRTSTEKIARAMAESIGAKLVKAGEVTQEGLAEYELIGFGSGIYNLRHHKDILEFVDKMPSMNKNVFVFSTTGNIRDVNHRLIKEKLMEKGCKVVGEFTCFGEFSPLGFFVNLPGPLVFIGGKNKGHPDSKDLENARMFAKSMVNAATNKYAEK